MKTIASDAELRRATWFASAMGFAAACTARALGFSSFPSFFPGKEGIWQFLRP